MLANSGAGLLVVEATHVECHGRITHGCLGLYSDACEAALERVVAHCRRIGSAKLGIQLSHAGRKASAQRPWEGGKALPARRIRGRRFAPSAIPFGPGWHMPLAMTEDDMVRVQVAFVDAAKAEPCASASTLSSCTWRTAICCTALCRQLRTRATTRWGGSLEGRMRFPLEVARAVRAVIPHGTPYGARLTGSDWLDRRARRGGRDHACPSRSRKRASTTSIVLRPAASARKDRRACRGIQATMLRSPIRSGAKPQSQPGSSGCSTNPKQAECDRG